jgi:DNA-binding HxlR family transcriptional regulator
LLEILGKPHTLAILYSFQITSPMRFTKLRKSLELQPKILSARLQELVEFGLLSRKAYNEVPPHVEYEPTGKGKGLHAMFEALHAWQERYEKPLAAPGLLSRGKVSSRG